MSMVIHIYRESIKSVEQQPETSKEGRGRMKGG
jgi:hypothetical protein